MPTLEDIAEEVARRVEAANGVLSAELDYEGSGLDELRLRVRRDELERYGLTAQQVGQTLAFAMRSNRLPPYWDGEREIDVLSVFALEDRADIETLRDFGLFSPALQTLVPIRAVTDVEVARGPSQIERRDRRTGVAVKVDLLEDASEEAVYAGIENQLADLALPRGYSWSAGEERNERAADDAARNLALLLSITFVFLLMGVLFESFLLPLCIITTIPMAMVGAFWGLWLTNTPMDVMAGVGLVILIGVIVNNGIVLVDLVTQLRHEGVDRDLALVEAGRRRLRPILMTALTTICGLVPMAVGTSTFVGIPYAPLGRVVMSGLVVGTLLTLLFVPWLYALLDSLRTRGGGVLGFVRGAALAAGAVLLVFPGRAGAEWPLSYQDALTHAEAANPTLLVAAARRDATESTVLAARGAFDPSWDSTANWSRRQNKGFFQGFPFEGDTRFWNVNTSLGGTLPTGTRVSVDGSLDRNLSSFLTQFGQGLENESIQDAYTANVGFSITQSLLEGHQLSYNLRHVTRARSSLALADLQQEKARQETLRGTAAAYWAWTYQVALADIAHESVRVAAEGLRIGELRLAEKEIAPVEVSRLRAAHVQSRTAALDADLAARSAANSLLLLMGEAPGQDVIPSTPAADAPPVRVVPGDLGGVALAQNLDLAVKRAELEQARAAVRDARHALLPSLSATLSGGLGSQDTTSTTAAPSAGAALKGLTGSEAFPNLAVAGNLSVPLGNRVARGARDQADADLWVKEIELAELERKVLADVAAQGAQVEAAQTRVELARANLGLAEQTLAAEQALVDAGRLVMKDLLEARTEVDRTRAELAKAYTDQRLAMAQLQALLGILERE